MKHTPYGYSIIDGMPVINEKEAIVLRKICENYISGMSFVKAAKEAGLYIGHSRVKRLMLNKRYLGDEFYPAILREEIVEEVKFEIKRRAKALGRKGGKQKKIINSVIYTDFSIPKIELKYENPVKQAEYAYSLIGNEVSG